MTVRSLLLSDVIACLGPARRPSSRALTSQYTFRSETFYPAQRPQAQTKHKHHTIEKRKQNPIQKVGHIQYLRDVVYTVQYVRMSPSYALPRQEGRKE
jgi:hypothetical protein